MEVKATLTPKGVRDYHLISQALNERSEKAFASLMELYWDTIYYFLLKMTNHHEDAEDLAIETFGKAFANLSQYSTDYAFSTWLFRIASNHCIDFMRKKKKNVLNNNGNENLELSDRVDSVETDNAGADEAILRAERVIIVGELLKRLKPRYRELLRLRYFEDKSYEEICIQLHLPLGTVKAQLFRARGLLSQIIMQSDNKP